MKSVIIIIGASTSSPLTGAPEEVLAKLKCSVCGELLTCPPIIWYACKGNVCGRCSNINIRRGPNEDGVRNDAFEALAQLQSLPCRYVNKGCYSVFKWGAVQLHEETCDYRNHLCPTIGLGCQWGGCKGEMKKHYKEKHSQIIYKIDNPFNIPLTSDLIQNIFFENLTKPFLLHIVYKKSEFIIWVALLYFDAPDENKNYEFKIELTSPNNSLFSYKGSKKYCFIANNLPLNKSDLLEINLNKLELLVQNTKNLKCHVYVSMT